MRSRVSPSNNGRHSASIIAAVTILFLAVLAAAFFFVGRTGVLILENPETGGLYGRFRLHTGDMFSVGFVHSVNKSPVTDYYEVRSDGIYVVKTVYYGFGAGVQTELEGNEKLEYGEDGSMIITGFDRKIPDLIYFVGTVSDHTLVLRDKETISLRGLCGRSAKVRFRFEKGLKALPFLLRKPDISGSEGIT